MQPSALCIYFSLIAERLCCRAENWVFLVSVVQCITNLHAVHANNPTLSVEAKPARTIEAEELTVVLTGTNLLYRTPVVSFSSFKTLPPLVYDHTCVLLGLFLFSFPQINPQSEMKLAAVRSVPHRGTLLYSRSDILRTVSRLTHLTIDEMTLTVSSSQCPFLFSLHFTSDLGCFCADTEGLCSLSFYIKRAQNERCSHSSLLPQPSILNTISNIFSCDMVHLVSQQLILEEGMDLTGQRCSQTHSYMLTNEVLAVHNQNAYFRGILRSFLAE